MIVPDFQNTDVGQQIATIASRWRAGKVSTGTTRGRGTPSALPMAEPSLWAARAVGGGTASCRAMPEMTTSSLRY
jgi:hypothetical protein